MGQRNVRNPERDIQPLIIAHRMTARRCLYIVLAGLPLGLLGSRWLPEAFVFLRIPLVFSWLSGLVILATVLCGQVRISVAKAGRAERNGTSLLN
jgi:hypothetical protein